MTAGVVYRPGHAPAERAAALAKAKTRKCLRCREDFLSEGPGNRICGVCKGSEDWRAGAGVFDTAAGGFPRGRLGQEGR